ADAEAVVREVERSGGPRAIAIQAELTDAGANEECVAATLKAFGRLDAFVANAGIWPADPVALADMTIEQWRRTVATNLDSVFYGCRAAAPELKDGGAIVI